MNANETSARLEQHAALTIQTTPEVAQQIIEAIDQLSKNVPDFSVLHGSDCVMMCADLLKLAGIDVPHGPLPSPTDLWSWLYDHYSAEALSANAILGMGMFRYQPGRDFGSPMSVFPHGTNPFYNLDLLNRLIENQQKPTPKGCVTVQGPTGPTTGCS